MVSVTIFPFLIQYCVFAANGAGHSRKSLREKEKAAVALQTGGSSHLAVNASISAHFGRNVVESIMFRFKNSCCLWYSAIIGCGLLIFVACAPGNVRINEMLPDQMDSLERHSGLVELKVKGGQDSHEMNLPQIPNADFKMALQSAIEQSQIFTQVGGEDGADYRLEAVIFNLSQPMFVNGDVSLEVAYILSLISTGDVLWQEAITTVGDGKASDSVSYDKRVATEQAAKENIRKAIESLSKVDL